jgi:transcription elongation factor GreA
MNMKNEITEVDVKKINEELAHRKFVLRPQLHEEVKRTREYGDLSENDEYRTAKRERNRNESRIRYLDRLLLTATVVKAGNTRGGIGLFDIVTFRNERTGSERRIQLVTSLRQDALKGFISKESPVGRALYGRRVGDCVHVEIAPGNEYDITILAVEAGEDNENLPISSY